METTKLIKEKIKEKKVILGYSRVMKTIKTGKPMLIVFANDLPEEKEKTVKHNTQIAEIDIKKYPENSVNLGLICGKPFPVSILAIEK